MANTNAPFGFRVARRLDGGVPNFSVETREIASTNTTHKIHSGTPVIELATGYIDVAVATDAPILGIFDGVEYYDTALQKKIFSKAWLGVSTALAGSVKAKVIIPTAATVFEVQSSGTALTIADVGANAKCVIGTGNDITGLSASSLDQATLSTTNTYPFRIVGLGQKIGNDNTSSYNVVEVVIVNNALASTTGI